jgi:hypothetical protein
MKGKTQSMDIYQRHRKGMGWGRRRKGGGAYLMAPPGKLSMMFWHTLSSHPTCGNPSLSLLKGLDKNKSKWIGEISIEWERKVWNKRE